jgi:hypothetical protein
LAGGERDIAHGHGDAQSATGSLCRHSGQQGGSGAGGEHVAAGEFHAHASTTSQCKSVIIMAQPTCGKKVGGQKVRG